VCSANNETYQLCERQDADVHYHLPQYRSVVIVVIVVVVVDIAVVIIIIIIVIVPFRPGGSEQQRIRQLRHAENTNANISEDVTLLLVELVRHHGIEHHVAERVYINERDIEISETAIKHKRKPTKE
jgi:hypothetical protein